jgi:RNA polymerase sigma-70 factor (ECF subfamily)
MNRPGDSSLRNEDSSFEDAKSGVFSTTHWSVVLKAGVSDGTGEEALERLCQKYWYPIYAFVRRRGSNRHEAEDLTQAFFSHLLENDALKKVERHKGKFRSFLLAALTNFLSNEWDKRQTLKRGGGRQVISLDEAAPEERYHHEPVERLTPGKLFERQWALTLLEEVLQHLREEYKKAGKIDLLVKLEPALTGDAPEGEHAKWAVALGMNEGAVRVALHRLRRRYGELLRNEIADTVASPSEIDEEIRCLFAAISI